MSELNDALVQCIAQMEKAREEGGKRPSCVLRNEFFQYINKALDELVEDGRIVMGRTINDTYFTTKHGS